MADARTHRVQAAYNRHVGEGLLVNGYCDWAVTACFYSALHQVDAVLASYAGHTVPYHPSRHKDRESAILLLRSVFPADVFDAYMKLKQASEDARYRCVRPKDEEVRSFYLPLLDQIKQFVADKLGPP